MNPRLFPSLILLAVLLASCAPATATEPPAAPPVAELPSATPFLPATPAVEQATPLPGVVEVPTALPIATSRGPDLHATNPATVSLASGQYQFVEFFRFT